jgi:signal transduction histidine kinase
MIPSLQFRFEVIQKGAATWWRKSDRWASQHLAHRLRFLWILVALVVVVVVVNGFIFVRNTQNLGSREQVVVRTQQVQTALQKILTTLDDAETGQRGYLLTGDASYLTPYNGAQNALNQSLATLQALLPLHSTQAHYLAQLQPLIAAKMGELQQTIQLRQAGQTNAALQVVLSGKGQQLMDQIRQLIGTMTDMAQQAFVQWSQGAESSLRAVNDTFIIGSALLLVLLALLAALAQFFIVRQERVSAERLQLLMSESFAREKAEDAVQLRDDFLAIASHELKTPITALSTTAQLLERQLTHEQPDLTRLSYFVDVQRRQTKRLTLLIDSMLDVTRIEKGNLSLECAPMDLIALVRPIIDELALTSSHHTLTLEAPATPLIINGDAPRLEQVWYNLLQNAIKYSPEGGTVTVRITADEQQACVAVTDQGIGIPRAALTHLFEMFYRASNAQDENIKGMGVGLSVSQHIVELHGGSLTATSSEGQGSTFTAHLPLAKPIV